MLLALYVARVGFPLRCLPIWNLKAGWLCIWPKLNSSIPRMLGWLLSLPISPSKLQTPTRGITRHYLCLCPLLHHQPQCLSRASVRHMCMKYVLWFFKWWGFLLSCLMAAIRSPVVTWAGMVGQHTLKLSWSILCFCPSRKESVLLD